MRRSIPGTITVDEVHGPSPNVVSAWLRSEAASECHAAPYRLVELCAQTLRAVSTAIQIDQDSRIALSAFASSKGARSAERNRPAEPDQAIGVRLAANGYGLVQLGVSDEMARGWARYDGMIFGTVRLVGWAVTAVVVARRRPTKGMAACNIWFASSLYVAPIAVKRIACSNRR